MSKLLDGLNRI